MNSLRLCLAAALLVTLSGPAQAMSITWTFQNTLFSDGSSLTGSFDFDADVGAPDGYSNIDLQTSDGLLQGGSYTGDVWGLSTDYRVFTSSGLQVLVVSFAESLTNAGGLIDIATGWLSSEVSFGQWDYRFIDGGNIVGEASLAAPTVAPAVQLVEPALPVIFALGIVAAVVLRRRGMS